MSRHPVSRERRWRAAIAAAMLVWCGLASPSVQAATQPPPRPPAAQDEFVPVNELPPEDQLPAAPLLIAAYGVAWLVIFAYVWSLWRRLERTDRELQMLTTRLSARGR